MSLDFHPPNSTETIRMIFWEDPCATFQQHDFRSALTCEDRLKKSKTPISFDFALQTLIMINLVLSEISSSNISTSQTQTRCHEVTPNETQSLICSRINEVFSRPGFCTCSYQYFLRGVGFKIDQLQSAGNMVNNFRLSACLQWAWLEEALAD